MTRFACPHSSSLQQKIAKLWVLLNYAILLKADSQSELSLYLSAYVLTFTWLLTPQVLSET